MLHVRRKMKKNKGKIEENIGLINKKVYED